MNANLKKSLATGSVTAMVIGILVLFFLTLHSCGGGGDTGNSSVYDENGNCLENCGNGDGASDGIAYPPGDTCNGDTCVAKPDYIAPPCHVPTDPKIKKICTPASYKDAYCYKFDGFCEDGGIPCYETDGWNPIYCVSNKEDCSRNGYTSGKCSNYPISKECKSDKDCSVPCDSWPPEVCWEFCGFLGEWDCGDGEVWSFKGFLPDEADGFCHFDPQGGYPLLGKPGDPNPRYPLDGEPKISYQLSPDGQTLTSLTSMVTCAKMVPGQ